MTRAERCAVEFSPLREERAGRGAPGAAVRFPSCRAKLVGHSPRRRAQTDFGMFQPWFMPIRGSDPVMAADAQVLGTPHTLGPLSPRRRTLRSCSGEFIRSCRRTARCRFRFAMSINRPRGARLQRSRSFASSHPMLPEPATLTTPSDHHVRLSEVISALSYALDLTEGQPEGHSVRTCLIGMRIGREMGLDAEARSSLFYALLLKDAGCSSNSAATCELFGADDQVVKQTWKTVDWSSRWQSIGHVVRNVRPGESLVSKARQVLGFTKPGGAGDGARSHPLRARRRHRPHAGDDGRHRRRHPRPGRALGRPRRPRGDGGEEIPLLARIACLAQTVEIFHSTRGVETAFAVADDRAGALVRPGAGARAAGAARGRRLLGRAGRRLPRAGRRAGARGPRAGGGRRPAGPHRPRLCPRDRRQVALHLPPFRGRGDVRRRRRTGPGLRRGRAARPAPRRPAARRGQAGCQQPHSGQTGKTDGRRICRRAAGTRSTATASWRAWRRSARWRRPRPRITSGWTGAATTAASPPAPCPPPRACWPWPTCATRFRAERPYRAALPRERVLEIMRGDAGPALCPESFAALEEALRARPELGMEPRKRNL